MKQGKFLNLKDDEKIIKTFPGDIEGHKAANNKALQLAIVNSEHGYYVQKSKGKYCIIEVKEPKKLNL